MKISGGQCTLAGLIIMVFGTGQRPWSHRCELERWDDVYGFVKCCVSHFSSLILWFIFSSFFHLEHFQCTCSVLNTWKTNKGSGRKKEHISKDGSLQPEVGLSRERSNGKRNIIIAHYSQQSTCMRLASTYPVSFPDLLWISAANLMTWPGM